MHGWYIVQVPIGMPERSSGTVNGILCISSIKKYKSEKLKKIHISAIVILLEEVN